MKIYNVFCFLSAFLLAKAIDADTELAILMPTTPLVTTTLDSWQCATENITHYFDILRATGALNSARVSYGRSLFSSCTLTGLDRSTCRNPDSSVWCAFESVIPSTLLSVYSSHASLASL
ncbi:hypothetical protein B0O99DRAFT_640884 [Bisporella sp. PMI_857]|nr:hypothetical protein B0O99DRAFT_640884 [Bisporella sp. PMI_857]